MLYCRKIPPLLAIIPMKSYDDLQRFKEKTQTNHIEFKDMSEQTKNSDSANWAIIKQLMNEGAGSALGNGQLTDIAAPQPITHETFTAPPASLQTLPTQPHSLRPQPVAPAFVEPHSVAAFVAKPAATQIGVSLLESISASLKPVAAAEPASAEPVLTAAQAADPLAAAWSPQAANPLTAAQATRPAPASSLMASLPVAPSAPTAPAPFTSVSLQSVATAQAAPAAFTQPTAEQAPRFRQLFSTAPEPAAAAISKDTLLQPLLERIASCR